MADAVELRGDTMTDYDQLTPHEIEQEIHHNPLKYAQVNEREELE